LVIAMAIQRGVDADHDRDILVRRPMAHDRWILGTIQAPGGTVQFDDLGD
jgi:hypothetical protein